MATTTYPHPLAPATQERLTAAQTEAIRRETPAPAGAWHGTHDAGQAPASAAAPRPACMAPSPATIERYPALAGRPDLTNHNQVIEAIGYHDLALRLSKRARWTRAERAAIAAATAKVVADARTSHQRALQLWSEIQTARGMQALADAQDAAIAAEGRVAA